MADHTYLECPCCGDDGAEFDDDGLFYDQQPLICGCNGLVVVDEDGVVWINTWCEVNHDA